MKYEISSKNFRRSRDHSRRKAMPLIDFIGVSLKLVTATKLFCKTRRQLKNLIQKHCEEDILHNEELKEAAKREKLLNILNLVDVYIPPTPSSGEQDDKPDDNSAFSADVQKQVILLQDG